MKSVLITGANRGMGLGFVEYYLSNGDLVVATCRTPLRAMTLQKLMDKFPKRLKVVGLELRSEESFQKLKDSFEKEQSNFDIVISNAGISQEESFGEWTSKVFTNSFQINVVGPALLAQAVTPYLKEGAKLIQISSGRGSIYENQGSKDGLDAYGISKAGLNMLTRRLAAKLNVQKTTVVSLNPGWVQTDMGGPTADLTVETAVQNMVKTIDQLSLKDSGSFFENDGKSIPW